MADYTIRIIVDPGRAVQGSKQAEGALRQVESRADRLRLAIRRAFAFGGVAFGLRELLALADAYQRTENRIRVVTNSQAQLNDVMGELNRISRTTRSDFVTTAELYSRVAINARELGRTQKELLTFTERLNKAIIVGGASAKEASAGLIQLSQGLASGVLRGDELRSVLEQLPVVADVIAKQLGVTRGELRQLGTEGKISAKQVVDAFLDSGDELEDAFGKTIPTIGQGFVLLKNAAIQFIGSFEEGNQILSGFAKLLIALADNFEIVGRAAVAAGVAFATNFAINGVAKAVGWVITLIQKLGAATKALLTLNAVSVANPFVAIVATLSVVIGLMVAFSDKIKLASDSAANLQDIFIVAVEEIKAVINDILDAFNTVFPQIGEFIGGVWARITENIDFSLRDILLFIGVFVDTTIGLFNGLGESIIDTFVAIPDLAIEGFVEFVNMIIRLNNKIVAVTVAVVKTIIDLWKNSFKVIGAAVSRSIQAIQELGSGNLETAAMLMADATKTIGQGVKEQIGNIPEIFSKNLEEAAKTPSIKEISNAFAGSAAELGSTIGMNFKKGLEMTFAQDLISKIMAGAEARAEKRQQDLFLQGFGANTEEFTPKTPKKDPSIGVQELAKLVDENNQLKVNIGLTQQQQEVNKGLVAIRDQALQKGQLLSGMEMTAIAAQLKMQQDLIAQQELLNEMRGPQEEVNARMTALNQLFDKGAISIDEYNEKLRDLQVEQAELGKGIGDGVTRGLAAVQDQMTDLASVTENAFVNAFTAAEDALVKFVTEGKFGFQEFATSILGDIARIVARLLMLQAIEGLSGIPGLGGLANLVGKAAGGPVNKNQPYIVGEEGPEIFNPATSGTIIPADTTAMALSTNQKQAAPQVVVNVPPNNISIVNVSDPDEVPAGIESPKGEQAVLNVVSRNKRTIQRSLS
jgi:tape measure domain-containing protein